ncbi:MAG: tetratricopeptide repeat protein [Bacteroidetes bacterium]|nr:tetratricopeptide repeat protein [Bacteroidota bacterium]
MIRFIIAGRTCFINILLLFGLFSDGLLIAQDFRKIDSLKMVLDTSRTNKDKFQVELELSRALHGNDPKKAMIYGLNALKLAEVSLGNKEKLHAMLSLAWIYYTLTDYSRALDFAFKARDLAEMTHTDIEMALALDAIGTIYNDLGDKDKCSYYFFQELRIYEKQNDLSGMAQALSRIGVLYLDVNNYSKALEYLSRSLEITRKQKDHIGISSNLNSIANVYAAQNDYQKALNFYMESLQIAVSVRDLRRQGANSLSIGTVYLKSRNYPLAFNYFSKALQIFHSLNNHLRIARCQIQFGEYYLSTLELKMGIKYADSALDAGQEQGFKDVAYNASELLQRLNLARKDTLRAYHYAILQSQWKDSLTSGEKQKTLTKLEIQYQSDKEQHAKAIKQQRRDYVIIIFIIILLSLIIILFLVWTRQKVKAKNATLQKQSLEQELEFKKKELVLHVMNMIKRNQILSDLSERLVRIESESSSADSRDTIKKIARELKKSDEEDVWKELSLRFKEVHGDFYNTLMKKFPSLTPNELRLCAFLRLNMSSKEIAGLTGQQISSLETARHRLRQKLGISNSDTSLVTFLSQI